MLKRLLATAGLLILAAVFLAAVASICVLRFRRGDVYPLYSSLRSDPVGVKVFHDALAGVDGLRVSRNYRPLHKLEGARTLFYLGARLDGGTSDWEHLRRLAMSGGRVVVTFAPVTSVDEPKDKKPEKKASPPPSPSASPSPAPDQKKEDEWQEPGSWISWTQALRKLGIAVHREKSWQGQALEARSNVPAAEPSVGWHSAAWLESAQTKALYGCLQKPVIVERPFGQGAFVFATDSYFLSNEALWKERAPGLLALLAGENREIVFDESHLGSWERSGVSTLIREYRLEGVCLAFALLAALYIWKNAVPLLPRTEESARETIRGRRDAEGLVNLMRRFVPPRRVVGVCVEEWNSAFARRKGRVPEPAPEADGDPVPQFSQLARKLSNRKTKR